MRLLISGALRKNVLNNKKQKRESALAMEHSGYHDRKGWGEDKPMQVTSVLSAVLPGLVIQVLLDRPARMI